PFLGATIISKATWEKIPAAQRGPMLAAARKSGEALKNDIRAQDTRALQTMMKGQPGKRSSTLTITTLDPAALAEWRRQTEAIYPKMKGKMVPADLFDEVQRLRDEYRRKRAVDCRDFLDVTLALYRHGDAPGGHRRNFGLGGLRAATDAVRGLPRSPKF